MRHAEFRHHRLVQVYDAECRWGPGGERVTWSALLPDGGKARAWTKITGVRDGVVDFTHHYHFVDGEEVVSSAALRFRTEAKLRTSLTRAGFSVDHVYGGWRGEPVGHGDGELVALARLGTLAPVF